VHRSSAALAALALTTVLGACGIVGDVEIGGGGGDSTTTTTRPRPTTSTTEGDGPDVGGPGSPPGPGDPGGCEEPPVWAFTVVTARAPEDEPAEPDGPERPGDDPCEPTPSPGPTPEPELGTGDVQVTLRWSSSADIDLHVFEPDGTEIWFSEPGPTASGGRLDVDSNVGCEQEASVENVFWPDGEMPLGGYRVVVTGYEVDGCGSGDYTLTAAVQGVTVVDETGTVATDEKDEFAFEAR
jgi:hypothetical protein